MIHRLRMVLPPTPVLLGSLVFYLVFEGFILYCEWRVGGRVRLNFRPGVAIPLMAAFAYGAYRVVAFHPFYRSEYRAWLERTPWTGRKPLPLGPVALVWEDGVVLSLLALLSLVDPALDPIRLVLYFLIGYLTLLGITLAPTGAWASAYGVALGLGLVVRLMPREQRWAFAVAILVATIGRLGLGRSLNRFPWSSEWLASRIHFHWTREDELAYKASMPAGCGWPFDKLGLKGARPSRFEFARRDAILIGPLVGWWLFALEAGFADARGRAALAGLVAFAGIWGLAAIRLSNYLTGYLPPISITGRLATFRWIIPGYDVVFVGPICTLLFPLLTYVGLALRGVDTEISAPISLALGILITFNVGPNRNRWELTGQHRITPTKTNELVKVG